MLLSNVVTRLFALGEIQNSLAFHSYILEGGDTKLILHHNVKRKVN